MRQTAERSESAGMGETFGNFKKNEVGLTNGIDVSLGCMTVNYTDLGEEM